MSIISDPACQLLDVEWCAMTRCCHCMMLWPSVNKSTLTDWMCTANTTRKPDPPEYKGEYQISPDPNPLPNLVSACFNLYTRLSVFTNLCTACSSSGSEISVEAAAQPRPCTDIVLVSLLRDWDWLSFRVSDPGRQGEAVVRVGHDASRAREVQPRQQQAAEGEGRCLRGYRPQ